jgi:hypothetical protein
MPMIPSQALGRMKNSLCVLPSKENMLNIVQAKSLADSIEDAYEFRTHGLQDDDQSGEGW